MSDEDTTVSEEELPEDASEAQEAQGVAEIEMEAPPPDPDEVQELDSQTLGELTEEERAEVEDAAREAESAADSEAPGGARLSKNFVLAEFHCCRGHCAAEHVPAEAVRAVRRLVTRVLQHMRDRFGQCTVTSGYRNQRHNGHVGGESNSRHRHDLFPNQPAADVTFATGSVDDWAAEARRRLRALGGGIGGIGRYYGQNFVHIDLGPERRWTG